MMKRIIKDYFSFNSRERTAIIFLCCLMGLFWELPNFFPEKIMLSKPSSARVSVDAQPMNSAHPVPKPMADSPVAITVARATTPFYFDPNTLSAAGWKKLGIRERTIATLQHFIQKGGRFRQPEDLKRIWGFRADDAQRLIPYVQIDAQKDSIAKPVSVFRKSYSTIHINQATLEIWKTLPGIGDALAARLVKFRDKMGGFKSVDQVAKTYGLKDSVFQLIKPYLVLD